MITASDLSGAHLGQSITVAEGSFSITGTLSEVRHVADIITDPRFTEPDQVTLGRYWVRVELLPAVSATVSSNARVEVL